MKISGLNLGALTLAAMMLGALPVNVWGASCVLSSAWASKPASAYNIAFGDITVPSDAQISSTIASLTITLPSGVMATNCPKHTLLTRRSGRRRRRDDQGVKGYAGVYATNLSGVGYRMKYSKTSEFEDDYRTTFEGTAYWNFGDFVIELIKTGPITGGKLDTDEYALIWLWPPRNEDTLEVASFKVTTGTIILSTCSMSGSTTISLGDVAASTFTGTGTTSGSVNAKLSFAGCGSTLAGITFKTTGTADSDNGNLFKLSSASTAKGVGIELLDKDSKTIKPTGSTDWSTTQKDAQNSGYTFQVRYKQTKSTVIPGTANGTITIDATYK